MKKVTIRKILPVLFVLFLFLYLIPYTLYLVHAAEPDQDPCKSETRTTSTTAKGIDIGSIFGFGDITSLGCGISRLIKPLFSIASFLVILYFLLGAFRFLKAGGNKEDMDAARQMISHAIIGFVILMFAFFILQYIPQFFQLPGLDIITGGQPR